MKGYGFLTFIHLGRIEKVDARFTDLTDLHEVRQQGSGVGDVGLVRSVARCGVPPEGPAPVGIPG